MTVRPAGSGRPAVSGRSHGNTPVDFPPDDDAPLADLTPFDEAVDASPDSHDASPDSHDASP